MELHKKIDKLKLKPLTLHPDYEKFPQYVRDEFLFYKGGKIDVAFKYEHLDKWTLRSLKKYYKEVQFEESKLNIGYWWSKLKG